MKHRFLHVDIAKGLGIFFVVLGHNWWVLVHKGEAYRILYSFHVPLFFLLSGLFLRRDRPFRAFFFSKMDALCKPYVVVLSCLAIFSLVEDPIHLWQTLLGILYGNGDTIDWTPLWFLPHLCVVSFSSFLGGEGAAWSSLLSLVFALLLSVLLHGLVKRVRVLSYFLLPAKDRSTS